MDVTDIFGAPLPIIGLVHLPPLPGSPGNCLSIDAIETWVLRDVEALVSGGVDGLMVENFGDAPYYPVRVPSDTVALMTVLAHEVRMATEVPVGINVLRNDGFAALAIAAATGARFVRVNVYTGARLTDQGLIHGEAHELQRYRMVLGTDAKIFADVAVKHSSPIAERSLTQEVIDTLERGKADAIIVSGEGTGLPTSVESLQEANRAAGSAPVFVGSGVSLTNLDSLLPLADGFIIGTALKQDGVVTNPVSVSRVREIVSRIRKSKGQR